MRKTASLDANDTQRGRVVMRKYLWIVLVNVFAFCISTIGCTGVDDGSNVNSDSGADSDTDSDADSDTDSDADSDADSDTDWDTDLGIDSDVDSDTDSDLDSEDIDSGAGSDADSDSDSVFWEECPPGSIEYKTSSGNKMCCPSKDSVFCDEIGDYPGGCWSEGTVCETLIYCEGQWKACMEEALSYCNDVDEFSCRVCFDGYERHKTASGMPICCAPDRPVFCDETRDGYEGGCWQEKVDCQTLTYCQGGWRTCFEGMEVICINDMYGCS